MIIISVCLLLGLHVKKNVVPARKQIKIEKNWIKIGQPFGTTQIKRIWRHLLVIDWTISDMY